MKVETRRAQAQRVHRRKRLLRVCGLAVVAMILLATLVVGIGWYLLRSKPRAYTDAMARIQKLDVNTRKNRAEQIESRFFSELLSGYPQEGESGIAPRSANTNAAPDNASDQRPLSNNPASNRTNRSHPQKRTANPARTIEITVEELNIWLDQRLETWLANQKMTMPRELNRVLVAVDNGQPTIMLEITTPQLDQIVSLDCYVQMKDDGKLFARVDRISGGNLPMPAETLAAQFSDAGDERMRQAINKLKQAVEGVEVDPVLEDYKPARRLVDFDMNQQRIRLTFEQLPRKRKTKNNHGSDNAAH